MTTNARWVLSRAASCLHMAKKLTSGATCSDPRFAAALAEPAHLLAREITAIGIPAEVFWRHLIPLSASIEGSRQLAEVALGKIAGRNLADSPAREMIAGRITDLFKAFQTAFPGILDELELRSGPLREQWDARGPGMLRMVAGIADQRLLLESFDVLLLPVIEGGAGTAFIPYNSVGIEAVLANEHFQLPEVVRLGWLAAQLQLDLPVFSETIHRERLPALAALAMLPISLAAAEEVELARCDLPTVKLALDAWQISSPPVKNLSRNLTENLAAEKVDTLPSENSLPDLAGTLWTWWETMRDSQTRLPVALAALDRMLM